jgi:hypothetical protein
VIEPTSFKHLWDACAAPRIRWRYSGSIPRSTTWSIDLFRRNTGDELVLHMESDCADYEDGR